MKYALFIIFMLSLISIITLEAFEVKVLLKKSSNFDLESNQLSLHSLHGFVLSNCSASSSGHKYAGSSLTISCSDQILQFNDKPTRFKSCYIIPALSNQHQSNLYELVTNWFKNNQAAIQDQVEQLYPFFDHFSKNKKEDIDLYGDLFAFVMQITNLFLSDTIQSIDQESVVSLQTLQKYAETYFKNKIKNEFLTHLANKNLSRTDRKLLQKNKQYRYDFFTHHVSDIIQNLLKDFCMTLPRNILSQWLQEEVGFLTFNGNNYLGSFLIMQEDEIVYVINCVDVDDYLLSVIRHEGWPGWPLEVNKVLAVACRTYLVWQVLQSQKMKRPYHIENGIRHQTYKGHHKYARLKKAVEETKDMCIAYNGKPILAMFDACCGGVVPARIDNFDYKKHVYLMRKQACTSCKGCKVATWKAEFGHDQIVEVLQKEIPSLSTIDDIKVVATDGAGLVQDVIIETNGAHIVISGKKMYSLFPEIKSFCFDIQTSFAHKENLHNHTKKRKKKKQQRSLLDHEKDKVENVVIHGKGYGHHVGLCQWGAMKLVKDQHWNFQKILQFYYPDTELIKLRYQR